MLNNVRAKKIKRIVLVAFVLVFAAACLVTFAGAQYLERVENDAVFGGRTQNKNNYTVTTYGTTQAQGDMVDGKVTEYSVYRITGDSSFRFRNIVYVLNGAKQKVADHRSGIKSVYMDDDTGMWGFTFIIEKPSKALDYENTQNGIQAGLLSETGTNPYVSLPDGVERIYVRVDTGVFGVTYLDLADAVDLSLEYDVESDTH
jgi:hypothetical protein